MKFTASRRLLVLFSQCVLLLFADYPNRLRAQDLDNVTITGRVLDQHRAAIPGATVAAVLTQTGSARSTVTDLEGRYRLIQLRPGNYSLLVSLNGFASQESAITTVSGKNLQMDFTLFPQSVTVDPVIINSEVSAPVDTTRTVVGGTITANELNLLPVFSRSPLDLIFTLPGIADPPLTTRDLSEDRESNFANTPEEAGTFSLSGAPAYSNNLTIDGMDNNDDRAASERFQPSLEAVEEVQVITNQFSAEYGRASGGRVNIRTRSGSSTFRGRAFYFVRDEALNANTFRNNSLGLSRLPLQEHVIGFTLSGPISIPRLSNKTFFFVAHEHDRVLDSALVDTLLPVQPSSLFPLPAPTNPNERRLEDAHSPSLSTEIAPYISSLSTPLRNSISTIKIDHEFSQLHSGSFLYQRGCLNNMRQFGGGNRLAEALQGKTRSSDAFSYSDYYVISHSLVNQLRVQYSLLAPAFRTRSTKPVVLITINDPAEKSGTVVAGSSTTGATDRSEKRVQLQETLAYAVRDHSLKFGLDAQRVRSTFIDLSEASGTFNFASAGDFLAGAPSRFRQNFQTASTQRNTYLGFFIQDEWRLRPNLLVSYGLRYERETILRDLNNIGPRISVAFDPFNSAKTVIRFGAGIFYNRVLLRTIDDFTLGAQQLFFDTNTLRDPVSGALLNTEQRRAFIAAQIQFPNTLQADSPLVSQFGFLNDDFSRRLDPSLRIPESYQANFGVERDLGHGFSVEANFTLNRGLHLWREFNANAAVLPLGYRDFSEYLLSRDFANFRSRGGGNRPLYDATSAGELVRFILSGPNLQNPNAIVNVVEFGVPVSLVNLNSSSSATALAVALAALNHLRPDPSRAEVEQLISAGNSQYNGLTIEVRRRFSYEGNTNFTFRAAYTFSHLADDGVVNTSDALRLGDFRAEWARSLMDRRHRFVLSGVFDLPAVLAKLRLAPVFRIASGSPFNISLGGIDRNLDDVGNDRPIFNDDKNLLRWRRPGTQVDPSVDLFALPPIGQSGNLPRNAGHGPGQFVLDLNVTREFMLTNKVTLTPQIELDNLLNKTVFSFGSEFINFNALSPIASVEQRQAFLDSFLVATRTQRPRQIRIGLRLEF